MTTKRREIAARKAKAAEQRQRIDAMRRISGVEEPRLHHVPNWLRLRILRHFPSHGNLSGSDMFHVLSSRVSLDWLDHYGTLDDQTFVSEPYGIGKQESESLGVFSEMVDCPWLLTGESWWYPGWTVRILFYCPKVE